MSYKSILVNLDIDGPSSAVIKLASNLAKRFEARLIGLSSADIPPPVVSADGMVFDGESFQLQREEIEKRLQDLRSEFEKQVGGAVETEWRDAVCNPTRFLVDSARAANLIVTASRGGNSYRAVDVGSVALDAGRPVLVTATDVEHVLAKTVLVGWKDTREARRAVADALPFLVQANEVVVATVVPGPDVSASENLADVAAFLEHQGARARTEVLTDDGNGHRLIEFAKSLHADLVVSGAYGHSRIREWAFGGVTRALLEEDRLNRFMSY